HVLVHVVVEGEHLLVELLPGVVFLDIGILRGRILRSPQRRIGRTGKRHHPRGGVLGGDGLVVDGDARDRLPSARRDGGRLGCLGGSRGLRGGCRLNGGRRLRGRQGLGRRGRLGGLKGRLRDGRPRDQQGALAHQARRERAATTEDACENSDHQNLRPDTRTGAHRVSSVLTYCLSLFAHGGESSLKG